MSTSLDFARLANQLLLRLDKLEKEAAYDDDTRLAKTEAILKAFDDVRTLVTADLVQTQKTKTKLSVEPEEPSDQEM